MDWLKLADFFYPQVNNTLDKKEYVKSVEISFFHQDSFGNENINIWYKITLNEKFHALSLEERLNIIDDFPNSDHYIFVLRTAKKYHEPTIINRIIEFKQIYLSLTSYVTLQLEAGLDPKIPIKVKSLDYWPMMIYSEKLTKYLYEEYGDYEYLIDSNFRRDVTQFEALHQLAHQSKALFRKYPDQFRFSDEDLHSLCDLSLDRIRELTIEHNVPIKIYGKKTIDSVQLHAIDFLKAIKAKTRDLRDQYSEWRQNQIHYYVLILEVLYENYFQEEKKQLITYQQQLFLKEFVIRLGYLIQLHDSRFVQVDKLFFDPQSNLKVTYAVLKENLQKGERTRTIDISEAQYYLQTKFLREYKKQNTILRIKPFTNWAKKRKKLIKYDRFMADLATEYQT